jgi:hypothetical protein
VRKFPSLKEKFEGNNRQDSVGKEDDHSERHSAMVVFLITGQASCIAGQHRRVDGGYTHLDRAPT